MIIFVFFFFLSACVRHRRYVLSFVNKYFIDRIGARDTHELDNFIGNQMNRHSVLFFSIDQIKLIYIILMNIRNKEEDNIDIFIKSSIKRIYTFNFIEKKNTSSIDIYLKIM
jgi:hypothetical protein